MEDQAGVSESYTYDADYYKTQITDRRGHNWTYTYDSAGNVLTKTDPLSHVWTYTYNARNQVTSVVDPLGNQVVSAYDTPGNLTTVTEKNGAGVTPATTTYAYDSGGHGLLVIKAVSNSHARVNLSSMVPKLHPIYGYMPRIVVASATR